ncbi:hypothetical protein DFH09DRAFT_191198 [Mycena vulgaris]|nr:hypothetical protein DFH09DRAFT_191198 [Mycena vulgaris]
MYLWAELTSPPALCILECSDKLTPVVPPPQISVNKVVRGPIPDGSLLLAPKVPGSLLASVISILGSELHRGSKRKTLHLDAPPPSPPSPPQQFSPLRAREKAKSTYVRETRAPAPPSPHRRHANTTIPYQQRRSPTASRSIVSETPVPVISKSPQPVYDARANFMLPFGLRSWLPPSPTDPTMLRLATLYEDGPAESTSAIHIKSSRPPLVPRRPILLPQFSSNPAIYNTRFSPGF